MSPFAERLKEVGGFTNFYRGNYTESKKLIHLYRYVTIDKAIVPVDTGFFFYNEREATSWMKTNNSNHIFCLVMADNKTHIDDACEDRLREDSVTLKMSEPGMATTN